MSNSSKTMYLLYKEYRRCDYYLVDACDGAQRRHTAVHYKEGACSNGGCIRGGIPRNGNEVREQKGHQARQLGVVNVFHDEG